MGGRSAVALLIACGLGACAAPRTPELDYLPPTGEPPALRAAVVQQAPGLLWGNIVDHLQQQGLDVSALDEQAGELMVSYHGDPQPYVDCGWIVAYNRGALDRVPAASAEASFPRRRDGRTVDLGRDLRLDALMRVQVEPESENDAIVRIDTLYILTKTVLAPRDRQPLHVETISFPSGATAAFSAGTTCQPTGNLERIVLDALPAVSLAGS